MEPTSPPAADHGHRSSVITCGCLLEDISNAVIAEYEFCRICRLGDSPEDVLVKTPCDCSGSVGFMHLSCYRIWHKILRSQWCEICRKKLDLCNDKRSVWELLNIQMKRLLLRKYGWRCLKYSLSILCPVPILYGNVRDVVSAADAMNLMEADRPTIITFTALFVMTDIVLAMDFLWTIKNYLHFCRNVSQWWSDIDDESSYPFYDFDSFDSSSEED